MVVTKYIKAIKSNDEKPTNTEALGLGRLITRRTMQKRLYLLKEREREIERERERSS